MLAINKQRIADSFSRAAPNYDAVAGLQRAVATSLLERARVYQPKTAGCIVDLGCGTGFVSAQLVQQKQVQQHIALDIAHGMLQYARTQLPRTTGYVVGDAESLPLVAGSVEQVYSSLAMQWCAAPQHVFSELYRVLQPEGVAFLTTLGPQTLHELKQAWAQVDRYQHVNHFTPLAALLAQLPAGLKPVWVEEEIRTLRYRHLRELTCELKQLGAHNMNAAGAQGLTGTQRVKQFRQAYEALREGDGFLPATYHIYYLMLRKTNHG